LQNAKNLAQQATKATKTILNATAAMHQEAAKAEA
jgi:hypothetical protein